MNFRIDEKGEVADIKLLPELFDRSFEREVKRDVRRMKKHFAGNQKQNISVGLSFSRKIQVPDGRGAFMAKDPFASFQPSKRFEKPFIEEPIKYYS